MKSQLSFLVLLIIIFIAPLAATAASTSYHGNCEISFYVQKTIINDFSGTAECEPFEIFITDNMIRVPAIAVQITSMDTGNSRRDKDMRTMFEYETFPLITGDAEAFAADEFLTSEHKIVRTPEEVSFALTIRDITQKIAATVTEPHIDPATIAATLVFNLSLSSFELSPPSFMGVIRVKDTVKVKVRIFLNRNPASAETPQIQE